MVLEGQGRVFGAYVTCERRGGQGGGLRGKVRGFSAGSRRRMLRRMARVDWEQALVDGVTWLTVTYHDTWPADPHEQWLQFKALMRKLCVEWALWRREPQERGAPHWHALVAGFHAQEAVKQAWLGVTGDSSITQVRAQELTSVRAITRYLAKYVAKVEQAPSAPAGPAGVPCLISVSYSDEVDDVDLGCGRCWGIIGRANVPWSEASVGVIPSGRWVWQLRRCAGRLWKGLRRQGRQGFMIYSADVQAWLRLARYLAGLEGVIVPCEGL